MTTRLLLAITCTFFYFISSAQQITVLEKNSKIPINGVAIYNTEKTKSGVTDFDGKVDISSFEDTEIINFQHISHVAFAIQKNKIKNNTVYLVEDASQLDEVVLSVSKFGQTKREVPQQIVTVSSEDVLFSNPQTAADL